MFWVMALPHASKRVVFMSFSSMSLAASNEALSACSLNWSGAWEAMTQDTTVSFYLNKTEIANNTNTTYMVHCNDTSDNTGNSSEAWVKINVAGAEPSCTTPVDDLTISENTTLCSGTFDANDAAADGLIKIGASGVTLDCNGTTIVGNGSGHGIYINAQDNIIIKNCNIEHYNRGITATTTSGYEGQNLTFQNINITNSTNSNMYIGCVWNVLIQNLSSQFAQGDHGLYVDALCAGYPSRNITIKDSIFYNNSSFINRD